MNKLKKFIETLSVKDLELIKKDLERGTLQKILDEKIAKDKRRNCPICGEMITQDNFKLEFGKNMRTTAYFDAADCLAYFVQTRLKK